MRGYALEYIDYLAIKTNAAVCICRRRRFYHERVCCMGTLLIALIIVTVPLLYQIGMVHHVFLLRFMPLEKQKSQKPSAFEENRGLAREDEIRLSALDT